MHEECWYQDTDEEEDGQNPVDLWFNSFVKAYEITTCSSRVTSILPDFRVDQFSESFGVAFVSFRVW